MSARSIVTVMMVLLALGLAACGDDNGGTSSAELKSQLLPASDVKGFKVERSFEWDNPTDLTVQGLFLPAETKPSDAVNEIDDSGFDAAAGESLAVSKGNTFNGPHMQLNVVQLGSDEDAKTVRDYIHDQDLKQPCFEVCSVDPSAIAVPGIPDAKGAQLVPQKEPPPNAPPPFEAYAVEFPIGGRLYTVQAGGGPGQIKKQQVLDAAKAFYDSNSS
jgi:hypothetical protein